jgi:hypothetical protein
LTFQIYMKVVNGFNTIFPSSFQFVLLTGILLSVHKINILVLKSKYEISAHSWKPASLQWHNNTNLTYPLSASRLNLNTDLFFRWTTTLLTSSTPFFNLTEHTVLSIADNCNKNSPLICSKVSKSTLKYNTTAPASYGKYSITFSFFIIFTVLKCPPQRCMQYRSYPL